MHILLTLFWTFLKINLLSTSGSASTGLLYNEAVGHFLTEDQFVQAVGLATLLPGSDALQLAMFVGYTVAGIPGGLVSLFAAILPPTKCALVELANLKLRLRQAHMSNPSDLRRSRPRPSRSGNIEPSVKPCLNKDWRNVELNPREIVIRARHPAG